MKATIGDRVLVVDGDKPPVPAVVLATVAGVKGGRDTVTVQTFTVDGGRCLEGVELFDTPDEHQALRDSTREVTAGDRTVRESEMAPGVFAHLPDTAAAAPVADPAQLDAVDARLTQVEAQLATAEAAAPADATVVADAAKGKSKTPTDPAS